MDSFAERLMRRRVEDEALLVNQMIEIRITDFFWKHPDARIEDVELVFFHLDPWSTKPVFKLDARVFQRSLKENK